MVATGASELAHRTMQATWNDVYVCFGGHALLFSAMPAPRTCSYFFCKLTKSLNHSLHSVLSRPVVCYDIHAFLEQQLAHILIICLQGDMPHEQQRNTHGIVLTQVGRDAWNCRRVSRGWEMIVQWGWGVGGKAAIIRLSRPAL